MIEMQLDETSGVATYLQLVQQVHQALRMGMLEPGDQLPTAQQVVAKLAINPNTVAERLPRAGAGGTGARPPGLGTFITRSPGLYRPGHAGPVPCRDDRLAALGTVGGSGTR